MNISLTGFVSPGWNGSEKNNAALQKFFHGNPVTRFLKGIFAFARMIEI